MEGAGGSRRASGWRVTGQEEHAVRLFENTPWDIPPRCDRCGELESVCQCPPAPAPAAPRIPPEKQTARLAVEKRPKGKWVTVVRGLPAVGNDLPELLAMLKNACGAGGTIKDEQLEVQGEHLPRVRDTLQRLGYRVKG